MKTIELTDEELGTLIDALGTWMELPEEWEGEEWLRRQDRGADLDIQLRELLNRDRRPRECQKDVKTPASA